MLLLISSGSSFFFASRVRVLCSANFFPAATWPGSFAGFASFTSKVTAG